MVTSLKSVLWGAASMLVLVAGGAQAQNPSAVYDALINQMNAVTAPTLADSVQMHADLRAAPELEDLPPNDRRQVQRAIDAAQTQFFLRMIRGLEADFAKGLDNMDPERGLDAAFETLLNPQFGPQTGLFAVTQYRSEVERLMHRHSIAQAIAGQSPQPLRRFEAQTTCPMIEARDIPSNDRSLEALFALPFAFWDQARIDAAVDTLRSCGPVGEQFAASLSRNSRGILQRASAAQDALAWRAEVLETEATPAAIAKVDWFTVPAQFGGQRVFPADAQVIFGSDFEQAVQEIVDATIESMTAQLTSGDIPLDEMRNWCDVTIPDASINARRRAVMQACVTQQRAQVAALMEQEQATQAAQMLADWQAAGDRILAAPTTLDGARAVNWMIMPGTQRRIPADMQAAFREVQARVEAHILNTKLDIGTQMAERLRDRAGSLPAGQRISADDCGLPSDIPAFSPFASLQSDCHSMVAATIAEGQRRVCRDIFAQSGESYSLRQAHLTHPDMPRDFGATVEDLLCDPKAMAGLATVTLKPTRSWLWNGYNLTVDHGDTTVTGRLVEDGDQPGAWTVTHVDMPGIDRDAARSNNLGCFFEPRMCRAAR